MVRYLISIILLLVGVILLLGYMGDKHAVASALGVYVPTSQQTGVTLPQPVYLAPSEYNFLDYYVRVNDFELSQINETDLELKAKDGTTRIKAKANTLALSAEWEGFGEVGDLTRPAGCNYLLVTIRYIGADHAINGLEDVREIKCLVDLPDVSSFTDLEIETI